MSFVSRPHQITNYWHCTCIFNCLLCSSFLPFPLFFFFICSRSLQEGAKSPAPVQLKLSCFGESAANGKISETFLSPETFWSRVLFNSTSLLSLNQTTGFAAMSPLSALLLSLCVASSVYSADLVDHSIQYQRFNPSHGSYNYGYDTGLSGSHSFHQENKDPVTGTVRGRFGYTDPNGHLRLTNYEAGPNGYNVISSAQVTHAKPLVPVASGPHHSDYVAVSPHSQGVPAKCAKDPCHRSHLVQQKVVQVEDHHHQQKVHEVIPEKVSVSHSISSKTHHVDVKAPIVQHVDQVKVDSPVVHVDQVKVSAPVHHVDQVTVHKPVTTHHQDTIVAHKLPNSHHHPHDHPNYKEHGHHHLHHRYHDSHTTPGVSTHEHVSSSPVVVHHERRSHEDVTHHKVAKIITDHGRVTPVHPVVHVAARTHHVDAIKTHEPIQVKTTHHVDQVKVAEPVVKTHVDVVSHQPVKHVDTVVKRTHHSPIAVFRSKIEQVEQSHHQSKLVSSGDHHIQVKEPVHYTFAPNYKPAGKYSRCYCV